MHRWFFANDEIFCQNPNPLSTCQSQISATSAVSSVPEANWSFKVECEWQLCPNEFLAISGSCPSLGNWDLQASVPLVRDEDSAFWTLTVVLPRSCDIFYRYFVCAVDFRGRKFVRFWETHFGGRLIKQNQFQDVNSMECEIFGLLDNQLKIERGWLKSFVTVVQLKFYQAPFMMLDSCGENILLQVKVTPIKLQTGLKYGKPKDALVESCNKEKVDAAFAFCEVASLQDENGEFRKQTKYGKPCGANNFLIFNITLNVIEQCAFLIDLYNMPAKNYEDVPPTLFGYQYVMPGDLENSGGTLELAIICAIRHRPIGVFKCDYLVVKPMKSSYKFNLNKTFQSYWNPNKQGLYCGHRGCGRSFWLQNNILRENCLNSFNLAIEHGADMIEFDVQLTKDLIPIIYHDTQLCVSKSFDFNLRENDILHLPLTQKEISELKSSTIKIDKEFSLIPLSKLTLEQFSRVKVYEPNQTERLACSTEKDHNRPFITLQQVLKEISVKTGFVVDLKWPQKFAVEGNKQLALTTDFDKNEYVNLILSVIVKNAGSRRIIFSSCDADICTMVRLKQNLYPIMLASKSNDDQIYINPLKTIDLGINFAYAMELWGIGINCANILHSPEKITGLHDRGLFIASWGIATRYEDQRKYLKTLGVDVIISDRLNHVLKPLDLKRNIVYIVPMKNSTEIVSAIK